MKRGLVEDGAIRVATYSREHQAVVNDDGTIDVYRRPTPTADSTDRTRAALENINRRNLLHRDLTAVIRRGGFSISSPPRLLSGG